jgi:cell division protein FtsB
MDPWEVNMVQGLRQTIQQLKEENQKLKEEIHSLRVLNAELSDAVNSADV